MPFPFALEHQNMKKHHFTAGHIYTQSKGVTLKASSITF